MCKSTQVPIQANKATVTVDEDNSSNFLNIHMPSLTYAGGFVLLVIVLLALWRFWVHVKERRMRKLQIREMELTSISRSVHDKQVGGGRRVVTADGEELTVTVVPTPRGPIQAINGLPSINGPSSF